MRHKIAIDGFLPWSRPWGHKSFLKILRQEASSVPQRLGPRHATVYFYSPRAGKQSAELITRSLVLSRLIAREDTLEIIFLSCRYCRTLIVLEDV